MKNRNLLLLAIAFLLGLSSANEITPELLTAFKADREGESYKVYALQLPEAIDFAGEITPLDAPDIKERLDKELLVNTYWQSNMMLLLKRANKYFPLIEKILKALSFSKPFGSIIGGDSLDVKKPDPKGLLLMMNKFNCPPEKTLMIGDSAIDIETGKHAGVITCGVTYGLGNLDSLTNSNPDYLIDNLSQLKSLFK